MKKLIVSLLALAVISANVFAGGGQQKSSGGSAAQSNALSAVSEKGGEYTADSFNYKPVENTTGKNIRIAVLCVQNNPFWVDVTAGAYAAKAVLALPQYNATVDYISVNEFNGQVFSDAIEASIVKGYDGITTVGVSDAIVPSIDKAVAAGIPVYVFNSDTARPSKRTAFIGQDLYAAGVLAGETLAKLIGGQGKVGIITGLYSVNAHELRRKGGEEGLGKSPGVRIVGTIENHDSADEAYTATKDLLTANPDLKGIYVTAGGPHGAARAIQELGKTNEVALVCFDFTTEIISYLRTGDIDSTIGQDPFGQGADPIILAYNQAVTGRAAVTGNAFTKMDIVTHDNVGQYFP
ncbi:MAG: sugar ABC transporter substrate-binding protein [Spirochaetaceae bacterium]|jgi:ABC-type sugar transport system substrate-binding protein|nr:sugar ABC transporter substrate-binding protein [Spirochaetaceae bacterium]